jgi:hypothetical protein
LRRFFGPPPPPSPKLVTLVNRCDDLEARIEYLGDEIKALRGRVTGKLRKQALPPEPEPESESVGAAEGAGDGSPAAPSSYANLRQVDLARRFRGF